MDKNSAKQISTAVENLLKTGRLVTQTGLDLQQNFFAALVYSANSSFDSLLESLLASAKPSPQSGGIAITSRHTRCDHRPRRA